MIVDVGLRVLARGLLRVCSPLQAHAWLLRVGALLPQLRTPDEMRRAMKAIAGRGTCLSRALAVAARAPSADVVIGVAPRGRGPLFAHAWVEVDGVPIDSSEVEGAAIARLRGARSLARHASGGASAR